MLPTGLTRRLVNHARPREVTGGYAADWTMEQLRDAARKVADRIDRLIKSCTQLFIMKGAVEWAG